MSNMSIWAAPWSCQCHELSGGASVSIANGWSLKNQGQLTVARHMRQRAKPSLLLVTIREREEKRYPQCGIKKLADIIEDQVQEQDVVVLVWNEESATGKDMNLKAVLRRSELKYIDVGELMVVTNNRCDGTNQRTVLRTS